MLALIGGSYLKTPQDYDGSMPSNVTSDKRGCQFYENLCQKQFVFIIWREEYKFFLLFLWWPLWARIINLIIKINLMVNWYNLHGKVKSKDLTRGALRALKILLLLVRNSRIKTFLMYYFLCSELSLNKVCFSLIQV